MVLAVALIEAAVGRRIGVQALAGSFDAQVARAAAAGREARTSRVLFFGDSLLRGAVVPRVVAGRAGRPAFCLAVCGSQAPASYYQLRRALAAGARPEAVVVDFSPGLLRGDPHANLTIWSALLGPREAVELGAALRDPSFAAAILVGQALPSVRDRHGLRAAVRGAVDGRPALPGAFGAMAVRRNWTRNRGAELHPADPEFRSRAPDPAFWSRIFLPDPAFHPANVAYVERFLALAGARGVRVYWLLTPVHPGVQAACEATGTDAAHERFVRSFQPRHPHLVVLDARRSGYRPELFRDPIHLSRDGATPLSLDLADALRRDLAAASPLASRWVALPRYRHRPADPDLEDIRQSALALARSAPRR